MKTKYFIKENNMYIEVSRNDWLKLIKEQKKVEYRNRRFFQYFKQLDESDKPYWLEVSYEDYKKWDIEKKKYKKQMNEILHINKYLIPFGELSSNISNKEYDAVEFEILLSEFYNTLTSKEKTVFLIMKSSNFMKTQAQIANELNVTQQTISKRMISIYKKFKKFIE